MIRDSRGGYNRKNVNEKFFAVWTPKMAYVLGFMFADGSLIDSNRSSRTYYLSFMNNDYYLLNNIREVMKSDHKIYSHPARKMAIRGKTYISNPGFVLRIGNKKMYADLIRLGMKHRKSNDMLLPNVPDEFFPFFLRGYFDGDGCVNLYSKNMSCKPRISVVFTSGSKLFLEQLTDRLNILINIAKPRCYANFQAYNLLSRSNNAIKIMEYMYKDLKNAPYLIRKYDKYQEFKCKYGDVGKKN